MKLDLRFTNRPLEELWCQAVVILSFKVQDKLPPFLDSIDKKMTGSISNLVQSGIWSGECSDKLLFATQNSIKADKLLIHGLGEESKYSIDLLKNETGNVGNTLVKMGITELGFQMPEIPVYKSEFDVHIETATKNIAWVFFEKYKDDPDFILKMYISITNDYMKMAEKVANRLRRYFSPLTDLSIILDKGTGHRALNVPELAA